MSTLHDLSAHHLAESFRRRTISPVEATLAVIAHIERWEGALAALWSFDPEGALPDHLVPVLRYLAVADQPVPALVENFTAAVTRMVSLLRERDKGNPYILLLEAALTSFRATT